MSTVMRAKMQVTHVQPYVDLSGTTTQETVNFTAVFKSEYPADGSDEDNTYAKWTPIATASFTVTNPTLLGQFKQGEKYYVDFTKANGS